MKKYFLALTLPLYLLDQWTKWLIVSNFPDSINEPVARRVIGKPLGEEAHVADRVYRGTHGEAIDLLLLGVGPEVELWQSLAAGDFLVKMVVALVLLAPYGALRLVLKDRTSVVA